MDLVRLALALPVWIVSLALVPISRTQSVWPSVKQASMNTRSTTDVRRVIVLGLTCTGGDSSECDSCAPPLLEGSCVTGCSAVDLTTYGNTATRTCDDCDDTCASCVGPSPIDCTSCDKPSFRIGSVFLSVWKALRRFI